MAEQKPQSKEFGIKPVEAQMIQTIQQQMTTIVTNFLSFIAIERLGYQVTPNTQFEISEDMKTLTLTERIPEPAKEAEQPTEPNATAKAMQGNVTTKTTQSNQ